MLIYKLEKEFSGNNIKVYVTGQIKSEVYMQDNVTKELLLFIILSSILCSLVLYFFLGNIKLVLINFISVSISLILSFSLSNMLFGGIELVMILIPAIVFIITISDFMHLLNSDKLYKNKFRSSTIGFEFYQNKSTHFWCYYQKFSCAT